MKRPHVLLALSALTVLACRACNSSPDAREQAPRSSHLIRLWSQCPLRTELRGMPRHQRNGGATIALRDPVS